MFINIEKSTNKEKNYQILLSNLDYYLIEGDNLITNLSNLSAYLNYFLDGVNWVGFYLYDGEKLVLGPFQGNPACTIIHLGNGVCGVAAKNKETLVVNDVDSFPSHIACDSSSKSELVIPIVKENKLVGVLDVDSPLLSHFDNVDKQYLEKVIVKLIDIL